MSDTCTSKGREEWSDHIEYKRDGDSIPDVNLRRKQPKGSAEHNSLPLSRIPSDSPFI